jgi:hypothetical protein
MTPQAAPPPPPFSTPEREALVALRHRFAPHYDRFSAPESAHLRLLRWRS